MIGTGIHRRTLVAAVAVFAAAPPLARASAARPKVTMTTGQGVITLELAADEAPITAANFLRYVDARRFDGSSFYRALRTGEPGAGLIEGGLQNDPARLFAPIAHESTAQTGLSHLDGTISMARYGPGTATADFFICGGPAPYLDANPAAAGDHLGYAAFGQVTQGMDVVRAILALPTNGVARNPAMKGQMLSPPVPIVTMRRA
jgi:peptidyl-prolyl cis-trans isomerase A (cyclophilin A)